MYYLCLNEYFLLTSLIPPLFLMTVVLHADNNNFRGYIPKEITKLENLKELRLVLNHLSGELPSNIGNMKSLGNYLTMFAVFL